MKKSSVLFVVALAMISCGSTYKAKKVSLNGFQDSINYVVGFHNGVMLKSQIFAKDSGEAVIKAFIDAMTDGYTKDSPQPSQAEEVGTNIGNALKNSEKVGLADNADWPMDEEMFFKGFINGMLSDTSIITFEAAQNYFQAIATRPADSSKTNKQPLLKKAQCPTKKEVQTANVQTFYDSINYIFGYLNGYQINLYILSNDSTGEGFETLIKNLNERLISTDKYYEVTMTGKQIGQAIKSQEEQGLLGINGWETKFDIIKQGFINGLSSFNDVIDEEDARDFISSSMDKYKFGDVKKNNAQWLEENAKKTGVVVTESGLQYEVVTMGNGKKPSASDKVKVHYHGTLTNGTVFDSSVDRGEPAEFPVNGVIQGWQEGLQLMPVGSKFRFYIKPELAYGDADMGQIPPHSILIFDVELLDIVSE